MVKLKEFLFIVLSIQVSCGHSEQRMLERVTKLESINQEFVQVVEECYLKKDLTKAEQFLDDNELEIKFSVRSLARVKKIEVRPQTEEMVKGRLIEMVKEVNGLRNKLRGEDKNWSFALDRLIANYNLLFKEAVPAN